MVHKFLRKDEKKHGEISTYFRLKHHCGKEVCDRVCTQNKKLYKDILASLDREKCGLENGAYM